MRCWLTRQHAQQPTAPDAAPTPKDWHWLIPRLFWLAVAWLVLAVLAIVPLVYSACHAFQQWATAGVEVTKTFQAVNRNCDGGKEACGTLADVNQTLHTIRGTFGLVETAAKHENAQLTTLDSQESQIVSGLLGVIGQSRETLGDASGSLKAATTALGATKDTLDASRPALASLVKTEDSLTKTSDSLGSLAKSAQGRIDDPRVDVFMTHLDGTMTHIDGATGDVQTVFDRVAHPEPCKTRACTFVKFMRVVDAAHNVPEFGYWTGQFVNALH